MELIDRIYSLAKNSIIDTRLSLQNDNLSEIKKEIERVASIAEKNNKKDLLNLSNYEFFRMYMMLANYTLPYYDELEDLLQNQEQNINSWSYTKEGQIIFEIVSKQLDKDTASDSELFTLLSSLNLTAEFTQFYLRMPFHSLYIFMRFKTEVIRFKKRQGTSLTSEASLEKSLYEKTRMKDLINAALECIKEELKEDKKNRNNMKSRIKVTEELISMIENGDLKNVLGIPDDWHRYLEVDILEELYNLIHYNMLQQYKDLKKQYKELESQISSSPLRKYLFDKGIDYETIPIEIRNKLEPIPSIVEKIKRIENLGIDIDTILTKFIQVLEEYNEEKIKFLESLIKVSALTKNTLQKNLLSILEDKYSEVKTNYEILKNIIDFNNIFYNDHILFLNPHTLRNIISVLKEYNLTKNNYIFLLCNYNYLEIYDLMLENDISTELLVSICHTSNPLNTIKRIIIFKSIGEEYLTPTHQLKKEVTSETKLDISPDDYLENIVPSILPIPIKGQKIEHVIDNEIVKFLDSKYRHQDLYLIGSTKISRNKFLRNYESLNSEEYLVNCMISSSILSSSEYHNLYHELNNQKILTK